VCIQLGTTAVHITTQNSYDNLASYHCSVSAVVYWVSECANNNHKNQLH